jgi:hypothetical protein
MVAIFVCFVFGSVQKGKNISSLRFPNHNSELCHILWPIRFQTINLKRIRNAKIVVTEMIRNRVQNNYIIYFKNKKRNETGRQKKDYSLCACPHVYMLEFKPGSHIC